MIPPRDFIFDTAQIRNFDAEAIARANVPGVLLMETAGRKAACYLLENYPERPFLLLCGPGNNGGDGLVIARYLLAAGADFRIVCSQDPQAYQGDAGINARIMMASGLALESWEAGMLSGLSADHVLVDALLGTGVTRSLRGTVAEMVEAAKATGLTTVAIDMPSGLNADTGFVPNTPIQATATITFQSAKVCNVVSPAADYGGELFVATLDVPPYAMSDQSCKRFRIGPSLLRSFLQESSPSAHKGSHGHAGFLAGSRQYPGAAALNVHAALHVGAGLSSVLTPAPAAQAIFEQGPEAIVRAVPGDCLQSGHLAEALAFAEGKQGLALGSGMSLCDDSISFVRAFLEVTQRPLVLDADALNALAAAPELWELVPAGSVLTPHPGEMARLTGRRDAAVYRLEIAEELALSRSCIVVHKGAGTIVALPDGRSYVNFTGNPGMGTAGTGDVLTGAIAGLMAQGYSPEQSALLGVYIHGLAGDLAAEKWGIAGVTATRTMMHLGPALQLLESDLAPRPQYL